MKKLFSLLLIIPLLFASCTNLDDIYDRLDKHEDRIKGLEALVNSANTSITALEKLMAAEAGKVSVTSYEALADGKGYVLTMSDGTKITLTNGVDGVAPSVSIVEKDGVLYWALNGELLKDPKGNPIPAKGQEGVAGITPKIRVSRDGEWEMSVDNGTSWTKVLDENGQPVKAVGSDANIDLVITETDNYITIKWNGQTFVIAKTTNVAVASVSIEPATLNLGLNGTATLKAVVLPADATDQSVTWESDNKAVATVDAQGVVKAVAVGTATITVTTTDGQHKATCAVTVTAVTEPTFKFAIEYVAEYNVNPEGTGFVTTHSNVGSGAFNFSQANEKFGVDKGFTVNGVGYHLPSLLEFRGISPDYYTGHIRFEEDKSDKDLEEEITIAGVTKTYTADYVSTSNNVGYGLRFKGDDEKQRSAWKYEYIDNPLNQDLVTPEVPQKMLKITVRPLGAANTDVTVETIADPAWWTTNTSKDIVRIFPASGFVYNFGDDFMTNMGTNGYFWTSTPYNGTNSRAMDFSSRGTYTAYFWNSNIYRMTIRLFSDK